MKVLGIVGSPRKDGNSDVLVKEFLDAVDADTEYIFLNHKKLFGCNACMACEEGDCVIDDDGNDIIKSLLDADVLVFSSPIYYGQITAQAKTFIDRFYQISRNENKSSSYHIHTSTTRKCIWRIHRFIQKNAIWIYGNGSYR